MLRVLWVFFNISWGHLTRRPPVTAVSGKPSRGRGSPSSPSSPACTVLLSAWAHLSSGATASHLPPSGLQRPVLKVSLPPIIGSCHLPGSVPLWPSG